MTVHESEMDPVRRLIVVKCRDNKIPLAELSRAANLNGSYMHQFVHRGHPKRLPEDLRKFIAQALDISEEMLIGEPRAHIPKTTPSLVLVKSGAAPTSPPPPPPAETPPAAPPAEPPPPSPQLPMPGPSASLPRENVSIPLYDGSADPAHQRFVPPRALDRSSTLAVWVRGDVGRLHSGDLAFFDTVKPPRSGDTVLAVIGNRVVLVGVLVAITQTKGTLKTDDTDPTHLDATTHQFFRLSAIDCP